MAGGVDCGMQGVTVAAERRRQKPCAASTCPFGANMRAAQCVLGPDALAEVRAVHPTPPIVPAPKVSVRSH